MNISERLQFMFSEMNYEKIFQKNNIDVKEGIRLQYGYDIIFEKSDIKIVNELLNIASEMYPLIGSLLITEDSDLTECVYIPISKLIYNKIKKVYYNKINPPYDFKLKKINITRELDCSYNNSTFCMYPFFIINTNDNHYYIYGEKLWDR